MVDYYFIFQWFLFIRREYKLYRYLSGGLWINFDDGQWIRSEWVEGFEGEYIVHPQDGGMFSVKFKQITTIENYSHGHINYE